MAITRSPNTSPQAPKLWLLVHHPELFETACDVDYIDSHAGKAQHIDLRVRLPVVRRDQPSMDAFCAAIRDFYKKELNCGDVDGGRVGVPRGWLR